MSVSVEFPKLKRAKSYRIEVDVVGERREYIAPPFENSQWTIKYPPPNGFARFFVTGYGTGEGCAEALAVTAGRATLVEAKVSFDKKFDKRLKKLDKPPYECAYPPGARKVKLSSGLRDSRKLIVRRKGTVTTRNGADAQPINVMTNTFSDVGTVVTTGPDSIIKIGALDGSSVLVGPNTEVRLTKNRFTILKQPKNPHFKVKEKDGTDYKVRTCSSILSARG